nr:unnamed protein product [Trichobilharzia regenti]
MAMVCVQITREECQMIDDLLVIAGCSDGYVRLIHIEVPSGNTVGYPKFSEIGRINPVSSANNSGNHSSCCLDLNVLSITSSQICFAMSNSRGEVHGWILPWCPLNSNPTDNNECVSKIENNDCYSDVDGVFGLYLNSAFHWVLNCAPIPPFHIPNQLAFNCITSLSFETPFSSNNTDSIIVAVGADDGSVRVAVVPVNFDRNSRSPVMHPQWSVSCVKHYSSVVKLATCPHFESCDQYLYYFLSVASDQRLILWCLKANSQELVDNFQLNAIKCILLCGLGEPHSLSISCQHHQVRSGNKKNYTTFALVVGTGAHLIRVS